MNSIFKLFIEIPSILFTVFDLQPSLIPFFKLASFNAIQHSKALHPPKVSKLHAKNYPSNFTIISLHRKPFPFLSAYTSGIHKSE